MNNQNNSIQNNQNNELKNKLPPVCNCTLKEKILKLFIIYFGIYVGTFMMVISLSIFFTRLVKKG